MSYGPHITKIVNHRRTRQKAYRRHRIDNQYNFKSDIKEEDTGWLLTDLSSVHQRLAYRKRQSRISTVIAFVVSVAILYFLATAIDWHWLMTHFKN